MDSVIDGMNKVVCRTDAANNGKSVTISNGDNTWTSQVVDGVASFMIPSIPAPAKKSYTVTLETYSRVIELGFGDSVDITLDEAHEPAYRGDIEDIEARILTASEVSAVRALLAAVSGKNLVSANASGTTLYLTSL